MLHYLSLYHSLRAKHSHKLKTIMGETLTDDINFINTFVRVAENFEELKLSETTYLEAVYELKEIARPENINS